MNVVSLGFRTDLMLRALEGGEIVSRGDYLVIRSRQNPGVDFLPVGHDGMPGSGQVEYGGPPVGDAADSHYEVRRDEAVNQGGNRTRRQPEQPRYPTGPRRRVLGQAGQELQLRY